VYDWLGILERHQFWRRERRTRLYRSGERRARQIHRKQGWRERLGSIFRFARSLFAAIATSDFSQTVGSGAVLGIEGRHCRLIDGIRRIVFAGIHAGAIFIGENLGLLQIVIRVNV
jgi:hypothetical protein